MEMPRAGVLDLPSSGSEPALLAFLSVVALFVDPFRCSPEPRFPGL